MERKRIRKDYYKGEPLEKGKTSRPRKSPSPIVRFLATNGYFNGGQTILDYGAGKYTNNTDYLRSLGFKVYAYDPYNFNGEDGYAMGAVSNKLPEGKFDFVFTCYVLNVVPKYEEKNICQITESFAKRKVYHITRNLDIFFYIKELAEKKEKRLLYYFNKVYKGTVLNERYLYDIAFYGIPTQKGFQRIPLAEHYRYNIIQETVNYKIYEKNLLKEKPSKFD